MSGRATYIGKCHGGPWHGEIFRYTFQTDKQPADRFEMTGLSKGFYHLRGYPHTWEWEPAPAEQIDPPKRIDGEYQKASALLEKVSAAAGISVETIRSSSQRKKVCAARREFCLLAEADGVGPAIIADLLYRTISAIYYHLDPNIRERKIEMRKRR